MTGLLADLAVLAGLAGDALLSAAMVFLRIGAAMALLPAFGEQSVPARVRLGAAVAFTAIVTPGVTPPPPTWLGPFLAEAVVGLALGIGLRLMIHALQIAGAIAAQASTLNQLFAGEAEPQPVIANVLVIGALALAAAMDLHVQVARFFLLSYEVVPPGALPSPAVVAEAGLTGIAGAFALGFQLAMPFTVAGLLYNLALGVINRAMPMLMVSFIGAPALTLGGLALLAVSAGPALALWQSALTNALSFPFGVAP